MTDDIADDQAVSDAFQQDMADELTTIVRDREHIRDEAKRNAEKRAMYAPWGGIFGRKEAEEPEVFAVHETASA